MPEFFPNEQCIRCKGPISCEAYTRTVYNEESMTYTTHSVWVCYACGKEHTDYELSK